jgi:tetratricopeptide (TPR) repeat protein
MMAPSQSEAFGYGYSSGYGNGFARPFFSQSVYYSTMYPSYMGTGYVGAGYEQLSDEDMYLGSKRKGDRMMKRGQFSGATREYRNALKRATKFWGKRSKQAKEANLLLARAQDSFQQYGNARNSKRFLRAKSKGDRFFDRGNYKRALAQYQDALKRAHTDDQAQEMAALVVRAKDALTGAPARRRRETQDKRARGDEAMDKGNYQQALGFYASALTRTIKLHGADSQKTQELTRLITRAQEGMSGKRTQNDFRVAD